MLHRPLAQQAGQLGRWWVLVQCLLGKGACCDYPLGQVGREGVEGVGGGLQGCRLQGLDQWIVCGICLLQGLHSEQDICGEEGGLFSGCGTVGLQFARAYSVRRMEGSFSGCGPVGLWGCWIACRGDAMRTITAWT